MIADLQNLDQLPNYHRLRIFGKYRLIWSKNSSQIPAAFAGQVQGRERRLPSVENWLTSGEFELPKPWEKCHKKVGVLDLMTSDEILTASSLEASIQNSVTTVEIFTIVKGRLKTSMKIGRYVWLV